MDHIAAMTEMRKNIPFRKMHGLGNDFIIFDTRQTPVDLDDATICALADRRHGVGCDQLIKLVNHTHADVEMEIYNADGGRVGACGNATRCIAHLLMAETGKDHVTIAAGDRLLEARAADDDQISVNMGKPSLAWQDIPLAQEMNTRRLTLGFMGLEAPGAVNVGNPHVVFPCDRVETFDLRAFGAPLERHSLFPEGVNVSLAQVDGETIRLRVFERGTGITRACGTGACAALVAMYRQNRIGREATVVLDGGPLHIRWDEKDNIWMTGPVGYSFTGEVSL